MSKLLEAAKAVLEEHDSSKEFVEGKFPAYQGVKFPKQEALRAAIEEEEKRPESPKHFGWVVGFINSSEQPAIFLSENGADRYAMEGLKNGHSAEVFKVYREPPQHSEPALSSQLAVDLAAMTKERDALRERLKKLSITAGAATQLIDAGNLRTIMRKVADIASGEEGAT